MLRKEEKESSGETTSSFFENNLFESEYTKWKHLSVVKAIVWFFIQLVVVVAAYYAFNWVFHNPYCNAMFSCGCTWNWEGGWDACNIHSTEDIPKCPWCSSSGPLAVSTMIFIFIATISSYFIIAYLADFQKLIVKIRQYYHERNMDASFIAPSEYDDALEYGMKSDSLYDEYFPRRKCFNLGCVLNVLFRVFVPMIVWTLACTLVGIILYFVYDDYPTFFGIPFR